MNDLSIRFQEKIANDYNTYITELMTKEKEELISLAEEIGAIHRIYKALKTSVRIENHQMEYLLKFKQPLMVIHDQWLPAEQNLSDALDTVIYDICDRMDIEQDYPMEDDLNEPEQNKGVRMC